MRGFSRMGLCALIIVAGCSEKPGKAWIVLDLVMADGSKGQEAFNNPAVPDMTLADCEGSLDAAKPALQAGLAQHAETAGAKIQSAKCVWSVDDPIKPKS